MIDAAAIDTDLLSPFIIAVAGLGRFGGNLLPSIKIWSGIGSLEIERSMALNVACKILILSISPTSTCTQETSDEFIISSKSWALRFALSFFESFNPGGIFSGSSITAQAVTGPAHGPRPTSSTPIMTS